MQALLEPLAELADYQEDPIQIIKIGNGFTHGCARFDELTVAIVSFRVFEIFGLWLGIRVKEVQGFIELVGIGRARRDNDRLFFATKRAKP